MDQGYDMFSVEAQSRVITSNHKSYKIMAFTK